MKKNAALVLLFLILQLAGSAQSDSIVRRIVLIGDGGKLTDGRHPVADAVKKTIPLNKQTSIVYLGDNIYEEGLPEPGHPFYNEAKVILNLQLAVADSTASPVYIIPGNHDWNDAHKGGLDAVIRQQQYVDDSIHKSNVKFYPEKGCPGPVELPLGTDAVLVLFDSQWWLHKEEKPGEGSGCSCTTKEALTDKIREIIAKNTGKLVVVASHHPLKSNGIHGGYFTLKQHIFPLTDIKKGLYIPLPVIGSLYPLLRSMGISKQDLKNRTYKKMTGELEKAAGSFPNVVFAAGHEHSLQLIKDGSRYNIVSGGGCKSTRVKKKKNSLYAVNSPGFSVLEISTTNRVSVSFYTVGESIQKTYSRLLFQL